MALATGNIIRHKHKVYRPQSCPLSEMAHNGPPRKHDERNRRGFLACRWSLAVDPGSHDTWVGSQTLCVRQGVWPGLGAAKPGVESARYEKSWIAH